MSVSFLMCWDQGILPCIDFTEKVRNDAQVAALEQRAAEAEAGGAEATERAVEAEHAAAEASSRAEEAERQLLEAASLAEAHQAQAAAEAQRRLEVRCCIRSACTPVLQHAAA